MTITTETKWQSWMDALKRFEFSADSEQQGKLDELVSKRTHNIKVRVQSVRVRCEPTA